jgi:glycosyltransferase involved in cell wall biosynthesis
MPKPRIAIVSPFIDKRHGTERCLAEFVNRVTSDYEIHIYSNRVEDVDLARVTWHRIPELPGPHLLSYVWWFAANHWWRWRDARRQGWRYDAVFSPGINCLDADAVMVHVVFAELRERVAGDLRLTHNPASSWPRIVHRRLYYRLIANLERRVYLNGNLAVGVVSRQVGKQLERHFGRTHNNELIYYGMDGDTFDPRTRIARRDVVRAQFALLPADYVLLLIGNGWSNKGLPCLLEAMGKLRDLPVKLLVAGKDDRAPYQAIARRLGIEERVTFLEPAADVMQFYAACDVYVGPSVHDSSALPPAEAMACGLPVITSRNNGGSEKIAQGLDGFIIEDAFDSEQLARLIRRLWEDPELRRRLGENAARTAREHTWERNAEQTRQLLDHAMQRKNPA